jgi:hypothetical protein
MLQKHSHDEDVAEWLLIWEKIAVDGWKVPTVKIREVGVREHDLLRSCIYFPWL